MDFSEPVLYRVSNSGQRILLKLISFDDMGLQMQSPLGEPIKGHFIGEILIDPDGVNYRITKIGIQSNAVWLEPYE